MRVHFFGGLLMVAALATSLPAMAETVVVKRQLVACSDEASWSAMQRHVWEKNQKGVNEVLAGGKCVVIDAGESVQILRPGVLTATIGYQGAKYFTRADDLRR